MSFLGHTHGFNTPIMAPFGSPLGLSAGASLMSNGELLNHGSLRSGLRVDHRGEVLNSIGFQTGYAIRHDLLLPCSMLGL